MRLASIVKQSLPEVVEQRLLDYIRQSGLEAGCALPGELELARQLGVSRGVVREAISRLRVLGMIDSRKNRGAVLCVPDLFIGFERVVGSPLLDRESELDLMELRVIQELGVLDLFWDRKTPEDIAFLKQVGARIDSSPGFPTLSARTKDLEKVFHGRIFEVAGNRVVARMRAVLDRFYDLEDLHRRTPPLKRPDLPNHGRLVALMRGGDRAAFRQAVYEHLRVYLDLLASERGAGPGEGP